jgi:hypothetical protein
MLYFAQMGRLGAGFLAALEHCWNRYLANMEKQHNNATWRAWSGYSFEGICLKHLPKIKEALGISGVQTNSYKWIHRPENKTSNGAEGDLVIERKDQCINLGEIKYYDGEFIIDKEYAKQLRNKKNIFCEKIAGNKSVFLTLITTYGAKKNEHFLELIDQQIVLNDLFDRKS